MAHPFPDAGNLAGYIAATAGRRGEILPVAGGVFVASPHPVAHAFVNAAIPTDVTVPPDDFLDAAVDFFAIRSHPFVLWTPATHTELIARAVARGAQGEALPGTSMSIDHPIDESIEDSARGVATRRIVHATTPAQLDDFGRTAEAGFSSPGLAWLYDQHDAYAADGATWIVAYDDGEPVGTAAAYLSGTIGGIYNVATPAEFRGRGIGAATTTAAVNHLFDAGASLVVLQSSEAGRPVYTRLGFSAHGQYLRFTFPRTDVAR